MREIKFRVWNERHSSMSYTVELKYSENVGLNEQIEGIIEDDNILEQYTGLKDKNGVEIYEGDIIFYKGSNGELGYEANDDPDGIFVVEFKEGKFTVIDPWSGEIFDLDDFDFDCVIGNIHEKLDLLGLNYDRK